MDVGSNERFLHEWSNPESPWDTRVKNVVILVFVPSALLQPHPLDRKMNEAGNDDMAYLAWKIARCFLCDNNKTFAWWCAQRPAIMLLIVVLANRCVPYAPFGVRNPKICCCVRFSCERSGRVFLSCCVRTTERETVEYHTGPSGSWHTCRTTVARRRYNFTILS